MTLVYEKWDERTKNSIHHSFATVIQALRMRSKGFFLVLSLSLKYVTLGSSISVEVHHSCIYHVKTSSEMAPEGGTDDSLASNPHPTVRK